MEIKSKYVDDSVSMIDNVNMDKFGENDPFFEFDECESVKLFD